MTRFWQWLFRKTSGRVCLCRVCRGSYKDLHLSDCAVHNAPASPQEPCNCRNRSKGGVT